MWRINRVLILEVGGCPRSFESPLSQTGSPCLFCLTPTHSPNPSLPQEDDQPLRLPRQIPRFLLLAPISGSPCSQLARATCVLVCDPHPPSYCHFTCQWQFVLQKTQRGCLELASSASQLCPWPEGLYLPGAGRRSGHPSGQSHPLSSPGSAQSYWPLADAGTAQTGDAGHTSFPHRSHKANCGFLSHGAVISSAVTEVPGCLLSNNLYLSIQ